MKSVVAAIAIGLLATVQAQSQCAPEAAKIPTCAAQCIASAAAKVGCSDPTDFACQCKNTAAINAGALNCVLSSCGAQTGLAVQASASAVCECVATAGSGSGSSPSTAAASAVAATTSAAVPLGHGPVVVSSSAAAPATSAAVTVTSASAVPYPTTQLKASQISDGQVQASGAASPSTAPSSSKVVPFTGAGVKVVASVGSLLVAVGAAIVAL